MVDFKKLLEKPPMTEEEHNKLWEDWYNGLPIPEKKIVDKERSKL